MKVLFVNAINKDRLYEMRYPPLNLAYLVGALREYFPDYEYKIVTSDYLDALVEFNPDVVCISSVTQNYNTAKEYARLAKMRNKKVIMGGVHISALPNTLTEDMDVGVIGEGEETIVELFKNNFENLPKINGIAYRCADSIHCTYQREMIKDLDTIPLPARDMLKIEKHSYMFTSRGCPYKCVFCSSARFWKTLRFHSAKRVVDEILILTEKHGVKYIEMFDDLFIANKERLKEIAKLMSDLNIKVRIGCSARANMVDDETMKLLKSMGVVKIVLGLESGNERMLTYLKGIDGRTTVTVAQNYEAVRLANKYGILVNAGFVIGSPDETEEEIMDTYKLAATSGLNHFEVYIITPLPGTPIWDLAKKKGFVTDDMDWAKLDVMSLEDNIILSDTLSKEQICELHSKFKRLQSKMRITSALRHPFKNNVLSIMKQMIFSGARF